MNEYIITKRLPIGAVGQWGKNYKLFIAPVDVVVENEVLEYNKAFYKDIGQDVQFKQINDKNSQVTQLVDGGISDSQIIEIETSDCYWNNETGEYECIVKTGDIFYAFKKFWLIENIVEHPIFTPARQSIFNCKLKNINNVPVVQRRI